MPAATGLQRALAPFDRLGELFAEDPAFLESMFVISFEAHQDHLTVASTRPALGYNAASTRSRSGSARDITDGSVRADVDVERATSDVSAAIFGIAYLWIAIAQWLRPRTARWHT